MVHSQDPTIHFNLSDRKKHGRLHHARFTIHDRSQYDLYESGFAEVFKQFDGKMLSVDEEPTLLMGEWEDTRSVIIEFPSKKSALAWMTSDEYQAIAKHRELEARRTQY